MCILKKDSDVERLEQAQKWDAILDFTYQRWLKEKSNLQFLLRAGTEAWLINTYDYVEEVKKCDDILSSTIEYGMEHFADNVGFLSIFGYMIKLFPYFFNFFDGDFQKWSQAGQQMILTAHSLKPDDVFIAALNAIESKQPIALPAEYFKGNSEIEAYFRDVLR